LTEKKGNAILIKMTFSTGSLAFINMKTLIVALILVQCSCLISEHYNYKALDIKDDSYELSLPNSFETKVYNQKIIGAFVGIVEYKHDKYFNILVDSLLRNRYFSYLHILIPVGKNNEPRLLSNSINCELYYLFEGKCGNNGVILIEDSINYNNYVDTIGINAYEYKDIPDEDSIKPFRWEGIPRNIFFQFNGYIYDAVYFKYINNQNDTIYYKSFIKEREIKWNYRKKSKYIWNKTLSFLYIPIDIVLSPFEIILMYWIAKNLNFGGG
jgi:hypothetical protein